jgi:hypothetical protein
MYMNNLNIIVVQIGCIPHTISWLQYFEWLTWLMVHYCIVLVYVRHQGPLAVVELTTFGLQDTTATIRPLIDGSLLTSEAIGAPS